MKYATEMLRQEHTAILRMLDATEEVARRLRSGAAVDSEILDGLLEFFKIFADRCHHGKEEDLLFPMLERKGMPRHGGPVGVMLHEHEIGRALIREMARTATALAAGESSAAGNWSAAADQYVSLLRAHIQKENEILFVMAERMLTPAEQAELCSAFEKVEVEQIGPGTHERLHRDMERLTGRILAEPLAAR
jgi:hemerythrin-like domain-containing protein